MANKSGSARHDTVGAWAKRCYFAGRAIIEDTLRPHGLGATQWYVLHQLAQEATPQRELLRMLQVERATLSIVIGVLVRKGLVEQIPDRVDQRQKLLRMTPAGQALWDDLPDLTFIHKAAFGGLDDADVAVAIRVLRSATERLDRLSRKETDE